MRSTVRRVLAVVVAIGLVTGMIGPALEFGGVESSSPLGTAKAQTPDENKTIHHPMDALGGDNWTRNSDNPVTGTDYHDPGVIYEDGTHYVYVWRNETGNITKFSGSAPDSLSDDGIAIDVSEHGDIDTAEDPDLVKVNDTHYRLYFSDNESEFRYATASDPGGPWTVQSEQVLSPGTGWGSNSVTEVNVLYEPDSSKPWEMIYTGYNGTDQQTGYAYSTGDGTSDWTKSSENPVLSSGYAGGDVVDPGFAKIGDTYYQYYVAKGDGDNMGLATSTNLNGPIQLSMGFHPRALRRLLPKLRSSEIWFGKST